MSRESIRIRILEEELASFWPQWHVVRQISEGAFGSVYEICKEEYGVQFRSALKVIRTTDVESQLPTLMVRPQDLLREEESGGGVFAGEDIRIQGTDRGETLPEALQNEINIMAALRRAPNVVQMEEVHYQEDGDMGSLYIRMELLTSLQNYVRTRSSVSVPEIIQIGIDVCRALSFCEKRHIIHRDIKPANLFIDEFGNCKVGDFGASRQSETVHAARTMTGIGTISYMAPEIYYGKPYNNTVDLYALGLVLYQLLNKGRMPFMPDFPTAVTTADIDSSNYKRLHGEEIPPLPFDGTSGAGTEGLSIETIADLKGMDMECVRALDRVIRRACAYQAGDRYRTAEEMSADLEACRQASSKNSDLKSDPDTNPVRPVSMLDDLSEAVIDRNNQQKEPGESVKDSIPRKQEQGPVKPENPPAPPGPGDNKIIRKILISALVVVIACFVVFALKTKKNASLDEGSSEEHSWEEILSAAEDGTYKRKFNIGDTAELDLGEEGMITMELVAMDADELADGSGKAHMTWVAKDLLNTGHVMNIAFTNKGGWPASKMRSWLREDVMPLFPEDVRINIKEVTKYSYSYSDQGTISSADSIWIPSGREIFGAEYANEDIGAAYTYAYPNDDSRQKRHVNASSTSWWWLRSASNRDDGSFSGVSSGRDWVYRYAHGAHGVVIGFCL